jgi:sugar phosphate isomerase/epimerase
MLNYVATAFSCPHSFGWLPAADGSGPAEPLTAEKWMDIARAQGLAGVEVPIPPTEDRAEAAARLKDAAEERGMRVLLAAGPASVEELSAFVAAARVIHPEGLLAIRATVSKVLCGDRRLQPGGWPAHLASVAACLREVAPVARDLGVGIALENHQDATSAELIALCEEAGPDVVGVCLDTANPLSVGEDPVEFAERIAPYCRHVHLKDYTIHFAAAGFRVARCAAGWKR